MKAENLKHYVPRFGRIAERISGVSDVTFSDPSDPFRISMDCKFPDIGDVRIEPMRADHAGAWAKFYGYPDLGLSKRSMRYFGTDPLKTMVNRVEWREDGRYVILHGGLIIGYLALHDLGRMLDCKVSADGDEYHVPIGIAVADRMQGTGIASLGILFLKFVVAVCDLGLLTGCHTRNLRARAFYKKEGFVFVGYRKHEHPGIRRYSPVFVLEYNEIDIDPEDEEPRA